MSQFILEIEIAKSDRVPLSFTKEISTWSFKAEAVNYAKRYHAQDRVWVIDESTGEVVYEHEKLMPPRTEEERALLSEKMDALF